MKCSQNELLQHLSNASTAKDLDFSVLTIEGAITTAGLTQIFNQVREFGLEIYSLRFLSNYQLLDTLPEGLFQGVKNLTDISLLKSRFTTLPGGLFQGVKNLKKINLLGSQFTMLPEDLFQNLTSLREINLSGNQLTSLPARLFQGLINLRSLHLCDNKLTELHESLFQGLINLSTLSLAGNQLTILHEDLFQGLTKLRWAYLGDNQLTTLPKNLFRGLTTLETIELQNNQLITLPDDDLFRGLIDPSLSIKIKEEQKKALMEEMVFTEQYKLGLLWSSNKVLTKNPDILDSVNNTATIMKMDGVHPTAEKTSLSLVSQKPN